MYIHTKIWVADNHIRAVTSRLLTPVVGNGILHTVCHKLRVSEVLAEDDRVHQERALHVHVFLPVNLLGCFIHLIGILCLKLLDGFQYLHGCTCTEVCLVEHLLVTRESHHSPTNLNVVGAQIDQFFCKDFLQSLEGLCDYLKFSHNLSFLCDTGSCGNILCYPDVTTNHSTFTNGNSA